VPLVAGRVAVEVDLWHLGFYQAANLQAGLLDGRRVPKQVRVARELNLVRDFQRLAAAGRRLEVGDQRASVFVENEVLARRPR
jgi:hypothetical protein